MGTEVNGAKRWIKITETFSFQPSEMVKFLMIIFYAGLLVKDRDELPSGCVCNLRSLQRPPIQ